MNLTPHGCAVGVHFADVSLASSNHGFEEIAADPELKQAIGHEHIAGAAAEVFAHADLLVADADESIASHPSADPLLAVALGPRGQSRLRWVLAGGDGALRGSGGQRLARTLQGRV